MELLNLTFERELATGGCKCRNRTTQAGSLVTRLMRVTRVMAFRGFAEKGAPADPAVSISA